MRPQHFGASVVLTATLASASWAQVSADTTPGSSQTAMPMTHLAIDTVKGIDAAGRSVTIDHQAIPSLGMPAMTMQFRLAPSSAFALRPGQSTAFTFTASANGLTIGAAGWRHALGTRALANLVITPEICTTSQLGLASRAWVTGVGERAASARLHEIRALFESS